jgi:hypothetical protein
MVVRRFAPLAVALILAAALTASPAAASYGTTVVISLKTPAFHGKLKSSRSSCVGGRTVKLFRQKAGPDRLLGTDGSNAKGKWAIPIGRLRSGASYYAKATAKGSCRAAKSKVLNIG